MPFDFGYFFMLGWFILIPVIAKRLPVAHPWRLATMLYALALAPVLSVAVSGLCFCFSPDPQDVAARRSFVARYFSRIHTMHLMHLMHSPFARSPMIAHATASA
ncbi:MAG: hypothetical protein ABI120_19645 [Gemmatimonadaceae bacterium]